jgi:hypothetical protein
MGLLSYKNIPQMTKEKKQQECILKMGSLTYTTQVAKDGKRIN